MTALTTSTVKVDSASLVAELTAINVKTTKTVLMALALSSAQTPKTALLIKPAMMTDSANLVAEKLASNARKMFGALSANAEESAPNLIYLTAITMNYAKVGSAFPAAVLPTTSVNQASGVLTTNAWTNAMS